MQPSYLPWQGFFNLILNSDEFVFLDDAQYSKNSYFNRNRYPSNAELGFSWLTVPVSQRSLNQKINETQIIDERKWRHKHLSTIQINYRNAKMFNAFFPVLKLEIENPGHVFLSKLNISLIQAICNYLGLNRKFWVSSELKLESQQRSERLLEICRYFECGVYLSPGSAKEYIEKDGVFANTEVRVIYQAYECKQYDQANVTKFVPFMSIIDLLFQMDAASAKKIIYQDICNWAQNDEASG